MVVTLRPHQSRALKDIRNGTILTGDVGSGKTITSLVYYYAMVCGGVPRMKGVQNQPMKTPHDLYVFTTAKKRDEMDWENEAALLGISKHGNESGAKLNVDTWANIGKYTDVENAFFIFDEQRLVGYGSWVKAFLKIAEKNKWIMLSATPGEKWMDFLAVFIANGFYRNKTDFVEKHVEFDRYAKFPKVKKYHNTGLLQKHRRSILIEMPFERHTNRKKIPVWVDYDKESWDRLTQKRWNIFTGEPLKNANELRHASRRLVNSDFSRLGELMKLTEKHPKLIVFYNFKYELDILRGLSMTLGIPTAEYNGQKHQPIPNTDRWLYFVQYVAGSEGWNCIETDAIVFWSLPDSWRNFEQAHGRTDRLNTPFTDLYYYIFRSKAPIDNSIWKNLISKENFNASAFEKELWDSFVPF